jgi:hypothetical protein
MEGGACGVFRFKNGSAQKGGLSQNGCGKRLDFEIATAIEGKVSVGFISAAADGGSIPPLATIGPFTIRGLFFSGTCGLHTFFSC